MNKRLLNYLRSLGLAKDADDATAQAFVGNLRGLQATIANLLDTDENDAQARTSADLCLRGLGVNPDDPSKMLVVETVREVQPGNDGASLAGDLDAERERGAVAERARVKAIREICEAGNAASDTVERAINDGWTVERTSEAVAQARRERQEGVPVAVGGVHIRSSQTDFTRDSLIAAMMLREGVSDPTQSWPVAQYDNGQLRTANRSSDVEIERIVDRGHELRGLSLVEIARRALEIDGVRCEPTASSIGRAIAERNGMGIATLTGVFSTSYTAMLLASYDTQEDSTQGWTRMQSVRNYQTQERTRLGAMSAMKLRRAGEEAKPATFADAKETYKVSEFAQQFIFDEQDLLNDAFGALQGYAPRDMAIAAAELKPDLVYSILLANANMRDGVALFHAATHGNLITTSALAIATLATGRSEIQTQQDGGRNLNLRARYLIGPAALESTIDALLEATTIVSGNTTAAPNFNANARAGLQKRVDSRLDNGLTDPVSGTAYSGSSTTWFLATGDGREMIEVGYIGELGDRPRVRTNLLTQGKFGIGFDVQHSLGAKALDWRGLLKATA